MRAYRRIIVLMDGESSLDPAVREQISVVARMFFQANLEKLSALQSMFLQERGVGHSRALTDFLDRIEKNPDYHDADKLVFRDLFYDLADQSNGSGDAAMKKRIAEDAEALARIHALYETEMKRVFDSFQTRAMAVRREAWEQYLASIKQKESREQILKDAERFIPAADTRGGRRQKNPIEIFGSELPEKALLLTFDDGPHPRYTDRVIEILKKYQIQSVFFQVGRNLGTVGPNGEVTLTPAASASYRILQTGSSLANHSYTHAALPKLDPPGYSSEIESTDKILKFILKSDPVLFRPPYGARNDGILAVVEANHLKSVMWNVDSLDWADPVPSSITQRVMDEVEKQGRGIILFHDIQKRTLEVLPGLIEA
ncbi:MAG: polysaccharide deacetylase family protein [Acidobacteria bacterium]|nr:polysaccharide deacetylase family protein [Acidobacteriota bacterium]